MEEKDVYFIEDRVEKLERENEILSKEIDVLKLFILNTNEYLLKMQNHHIALQKQFLESLGDEGYE